MAMANSVNWDLHWEDHTRLLGTRTSSTTTERGLWQVPQLLEDIPDFMKSQMKLWETCLQW